MGCCGSTPPRPVRAQAVYKSEVKKEVVAQKVRHITPIGNEQSQSASKLKVLRQAIAPPKKCHKCGYPAMTVNINNKVRQQCSNANCKLILHA